VSASAVVEDLDDSKIAFARSMRVRQRRVSRSSTCIRDQNASIIN
jgi:hypothetical protein